MTAKPNLRKSSGSGNTWSLVPEGLSVWLWHQTLITGSSSVFSALAPWHDIGCHPVSKASKCGVIDDGINTLILHLSLHPSYLVGPSHSNSGLSLVICCDQGILGSIIQAEGFPCGTSGKEPAGQCRRHKRLGFSSGVSKIPCRRKW